MTVTTRIGILFFKVDSGAFFSGEAGASTIVKLSICAERGDVDVNDEEFEINEIRGRILKLVTLFKKCQSFHFCEKMVPLRIMIRVDYKRNALHIKNYKLL